MECARAAAIEVREETLRLSDLPQFAEVFFTSSVAGLRPVRGIEGGGAAWYGGRCRTR